MEVFLRSSLVGRVLLKSLSNCFENFKDNFPENYLLIVRRSICVALFSAPRSEWGFRDEGPYKNRTRCMDG